jgi:diamine N-acetyltransferase
MIDASFQRMGFGRTAVELLLAHLRTRPHAHTLLTSFRCGEGSPEGFYLRLGFRPTGEESHGEIELSRKLSPGHARVPQEADPT